MQKALTTKHSGFASAIVGLALLFGAAAPATAHSFLIDANPSAKDHIATAPKTIKLKFGAGVEPNYSKLTIETGDGKVLASGAVGKPETPRELTLDAPADMPPARYIVRYRVLSTDGHIVEGNYEFTIDGK
ncbi:MAG TPA: copper resistance CopC family protein [Methylocystis sp.]|nr:copper resistance CopC family protein [Methylocystis sp.]